MDNNPTPKDPFVVAVAAFLAALLLAVCTASLALIIGWLMHIALSDAIPTYGALGATARIGAVLTLGFTLVFGVKLAFKIRDGDDDSDDDEPLTPEQIADAAIGREKLAALAVPPQKVAGTSSLSVSAGELRAGTLRAETLAIAPMLAAADEEPDCPRGACCCCKPCGSCR